MAADSASQIQVLTPAGLQVGMTYSSAEKLTGLADRPVAAMVHGIGAISNRSILSLIREFEFEHFFRDDSPDGETSDQVEPQLSVASITEALADFIEAKYANAAWGRAPVIPGAAPQPWPPPLGIVVGGYSPGEFFPQVFEILFPGRHVTQKHPIAGMAVGSASMTFWGQTSAILRLVVGANLAEFDTIHMLLQQGKFAAPPGLTLPRVGPLSPSQVLGPLMEFARMKMILDGMPLQDAVEFADYLGAVAIGYDRFSAGPQTVGGALDVLAIQPEGLSWYRRKPFAEKMARARSEFYE